jgi:hypothetical protein
VAGWSGCRIAEIPNDPDWHPLQHVLGLTAVGANVFLATAGHETPVAEHDERASGQQEPCVGLEGEAVVTIAGEGFRAVGGTAIAVTDPTAVRAAVAGVPATALLAVGAGEGPFSTTWRASQFVDVPRASEDRSAQAATRAATGRPHRHRGCRDGTPSRPSRHWTA